MSRFRRSAIAVMVVLLAGCATSSQDPWGGDRDVIILVDNRGRAQAATIFLMDVSGVRRRLGRVRGQETGEFRVTPRPVDQRLVADYGGFARTSRSFVLAAGERWEWEVDRNRLAFAPARGR